MASLKSEASPSFLALWQAEHFCSFPAASLWWHSAHLPILSACALWLNDTGALDFWISLIVTFSGASAATITPAENTATMTTAKRVANFLIPSHPLFDFLEGPAAPPRGGPLRLAPDPPLGTVGNLGLEAPPVVVHVPRFPDLF